MTNEELQTKIDETYETMKNAEEEIRHIEQTSLRNARYEYDKAREAYFYMLGIMIGRHNPEE